MPVQKSRKIQGDPDFLFDVTCCIGSVYQDGSNPERSPWVAAFELIGKHGAAGEYHFPDFDGSDIEVTVNRNEPREQP